jgi:ERCC4-type nuclease
MIQIDSRVGSKEFKPLLDKEYQPCELTILEFGDFSFYGNGPDNQLIRIGVERKTIPDLMQSIRSGRLSGHQIPGMDRMYVVKYLLIEGQVRRNFDGDVEYLKDDFKWSKGYGLAFNWYGYQGAITSFENCGFNIRQCFNKQDTVYNLISLYQWWQKPWDKHNTHLRLKKVLFTRVKKTKIIVPPLVIIGAKTVK